MAKRPTVGLSESCTPSIVPSRVVCINMFNRFRRNLRIRRTFGTLNPTRVELPLTKCCIEVNPLDGRVRRMLLNAIATNKLPAVQRFWARAVREFAPTMVVDVGVNYGECALGAHYPSDCSVIGVEANPSIWPYIRRTLGARADQANFTIMESAASDRTESGIRFWISSGGSGTSTTVQPTVRVAEWQVIDVPAVRLDERITPHGDRLLLKIDVEGADLRVLRGLSRLIDAMPATLAIVEYCPDRLRDAGEDLSGVATQLCEQYSVWQFRDWNDVKRLNPAELRSLTVAKGRATDLVLSRGDAAADAMLRAVAAGGSVTAAGACEALT